MIKNTATINIRLSNEKDFDTLRFILKTTWFDTYSKFIPEEDLTFYLKETYNDDKLKSLIDNPDTKIFIADVDSKSAGMMRVSENKSQKRFYLNSLYVLPDYQGFGVGKELSILAENIAVSLQYDKIWLGVMEQNTTAMNWYKKNGFVFPEKEPFQMGNTTVNHFIGYKILSEKL